MTKSTGGGGAGIGFTLVPCTTPEPTALVALPTMLTPLPTMLTPLPTALPMAPNGLKEMLSFRLVGRSSLPGDPDRVFCLTRASPEKCLFT